MVSLQLDPDLKRYTNTHVCLNTTLPLWASVMALVSEHTATAAVPSVQLVCTPDAHPLFSTVHQDTSYEQLTSFTVKCCCLSVQEYIHLCVAIVSAPNLLVSG